jgi:signal transduction histidine kinase
VWDQVRSWDIILRIPGLWSALRGAFQTDLGLGDVLALAPMALNLKPQRVRSLYIGRNQIDYWTTEGGASVLLPIPERIQEVVAHLYDPPSAESEAATKALVEVQNGTQQPYLADIAADRVRWAGFQVTGISTAERVDYQRTFIYVYHERSETLATLARLLRVPERNIVRQPDPDQEADMLVILGADYDPCR